MTKKSNTATLMKTTKAQVRVIRVILDLEKTPHNPYLRLQKKSMLSQDKREGLL